MSIIWSKIENLSNTLENIIQSQPDCSSEDVGEKYGWKNTIYQNMRFRRAHIEIVDNRDSHGIYILHTTVFPHYNDSSPIWGFDAICGKNKITGAFHDFSNGGDPNHTMMQWFKRKTSDLTWDKPRELPEWARHIFSPSMIAVGNLQDEEEVDLLCYLAETSLRYYVKNVGLTQESGADYHMAQNRYCYYQKQNPQVIKSMVAMGVPEMTIKGFVEEILFPEYV